MEMSQRATLANLSGIFFLSGFSALIYQICWQRLLFTGFGIDLTSITVIVSVFMMGLGCGAFFGGRIADSNPKKILIFFCLIELFIGLFGLISRESIIFLQGILIETNLFLTALGTFALLLIPTFLMGATLPLLTTFFNSYIKNIGDSIGSLYFVNTLGAAMGALCTGFILFDYLTLSQTIYLAAFINLIVAAITFVTYKGGLKS